MFDGYIRDHAHWTPRAPAVVLPATTRTYAELDADIDRFGRAVTNLGITPDSGVVSLCFDAPYLTLIATAACARLGIASSPFNDPGAQLRLVEREDAGREGPGPRLVRLERDWIAAMRAAEPRPLPRRELDPLSTGRVMLSSGTTGAPRRVAMSWRRIEIGGYANLRSYGAGRLGVWVPLTTVDSLLGFTMAVAAWSVGAAVSGGINAHDAPVLMENAVSGVIGATPHQLRELLSALPPGFQPKPQWRIVAAGALPPAGLARETRLRVTPDLWIVYGATESRLNAVGLAAHLEDTPGKVGITPGGAVMEILGQDGHPVPDGQSGEIRVRSERMATHYIDEPQATAERFKDGWFHTGDIGRRLPDGSVVLEGRVDDRMNLGGVKFMPSVLEAAAFACPGVKDAAAFAAPDGAGVDQCWLAVTAGPDFDRESLDAHLAQYPDLPPPRFAWIDEIPRNAMGKVERGRLREALIAARRDASGR